MKRLVVFVSLSLAAIIFDGCLGISEPDVGLAWIPAAIAAAGVIGSALLNSSSQNSANEANVEAQRLANESNEKLFHENQAWQEKMTAQQNAWNLAQWQRENDYNLPARQAVRLQQAGINPAFQNGVVSQPAGQLQSASPGAVSAPTMQAAHVNPIDYSGFGEGIASSINMYYQNQIANEQAKKLKEETNIAQIQGNLDRMTMYSKAQHIANDSSRSEAERDMAKLMLDVERRSMVDTLNQRTYGAIVTRKQAEELEVNIAGQKIVNDLAAEDLKVRSVINALGVNEARARINAIYQNIRVGKADEALKDAQVLVERARENGMKISNKQAEQITRAIVDKAFNEADESYWNAQTSKKTYTGGHLGRTFGSNSWDTPASDHYSRGFDPRKRRQGIR